MARTGHCSCGALRVVAEGEPLRVSICHCRECQRRTGSVYGVQARYSKASVTVEGGYSTYLRGSEYGEVRFHFCSNCAGTVFYELEGMPDMVGIPVGVFADAGFPAPTVSIFEERMHPWVKVPEDCEHWD